MKNIMILFLFLAPLLFISSVDVSAQNAKEQTIVNMVNKLQQKVLLTEDQKSHIVNIISADDSEGFGNARGRLEQLLDKRQKAKYDIIKEDWWRALSRELKAK